MAFSNPSAIEAAGTTFETKFLELFENGDPGTYQLFTEKVSASSEVIEVDVLGAMPVVREWVGPKVYWPRRLYTQTVRMKPWEASFDMPRSKVIFDKTGFVARAINGFLSNLSIYDKIVTDLLISNPTGYDGVALLSASHPHGPAGATQSNLTNVALSPGAVETAMQAGEELRDENSEPMGVFYDTLMVGPKNRSMAFEIAGVDRKVAVDNDGVFHKAGGSPTADSVVSGFAMSNVWAGKFNVVINPRYVGAADDYWDLLVTNGPAKPIVLYEGEAPHSVSQTEMTSEKRFNQNLFAYSVEAYAVPAAGAWQMIYSSRL
jgi:phage major head subunit gpT-like protein